jgi:hypothetical protein
MEEAESRPRGFAQLLAGWDTAGLLYGAVVSGGALAAISAEATGTHRIALPTLVVLAIYWSAHVYIHTLSKQLSGSDIRLLIPRIATSAREEISVLLGGIPAIAVFVAASALGASYSTATFVALIFLVVLLFTVGYTGARHAGLAGRQAVIEAAGAGFFGVLIVILKSLLH